MENNRLKYDFAAKPWKYNGPNGWTFVSLPKNISKEIRTHCKEDEEAWGRLKVLAFIGKTAWKTAIWFDTKLGTFLLPLKAEIRKKELIQIDKIQKVSIWI